jgi:hypothetical protein
MTGRDAGAVHKTVVPGVAIALISIGVTASSGTVGVCRPVHSIELPGITGGTNSDSTSIVRTPARRAALSGIISVAPDAEDTSSSHDKEGPDKSLGRPVTLSV